MARAKTEAFDPALVRAAGLAKALAHPVRIRILEILGGHRACICGGLVERLPLAQSTVSQHLRELLEAGFILGEVDGTRTCYCLDPKAVRRAQEAFEDIFERITGTCCPPESGQQKPQERPRRSLRKERRNDEKG